MTLRLRALALVALLPIVGCSATSDESTGVPNVPEMASSEVTAALSDGTVTYDEYESAYRNFVACMNDGGFEVIEHDPDANGVINYSVSNDAVAAGVDEACYNEHYGPGDQAFQIAHEDTSSSAEFLRTCLREHGIEPSDTMEGLLAQFEKEGIDIATC